MNSPERWAELGAAFDEFASLSGPERHARLKEISDRELAAELESLLKAHDAADGFIENKMERIFKSLAPDVLNGFGETELQPGERILHFEIVELLGQGSLARVYLARDLELERLVALKVSLSQSHEARTLAHFSIDGIVRVFSEHLVEREGLRLRVLCLQFIAGPTLAQIEARLQSAQSLVEIVESFNSRSVALEPAALKWREQLAELDLCEGLVLLGVRLAEILGHAHAAGVLHLDIKPANILIDAYGRPFLTDFNVSTSSTTPREGIGGTPRYMSPEQAVLFDGKAGALDERCDVFALGVVLGDLLSAAGNKDTELNAVLARAVAPERELRIGSGRELSAALCAWLRRRLAEKASPTFPRGFRWILNRPLTALVGLVVFTQAIASFINISYNQLQIVAELSPEQNRVFLSTVGIYNLITYPLLVFLGVYFVRALFRPSSDDRARRAALRLPAVLFFTISAGWLPGAWIFPRVIEHFAGPVPTEIYRQFAFSFTLAWLTSLTTTLAVTVVVVARALYPRYWTGESDVANVELRPLERINGSLTFAAALIPLLAVLLVVLTAPHGPSDEGFSFLRVLLLVTVGLGLLNLLLVQRLQRFVEASFAALKHRRTFG